MNRPKYKPRISTHYDSANDVLTELATAEEKLRYEEIHNGYGWLLFYKELYPDMVAPYKRWDGSFVDKAEHTDANQAEEHMDEEPAEWITVNGNHIPVDEDKTPIGGQMKALGSPEPERLSSTLQKSGSEGIKQLTNKVCESTKYNKARERVTAASEKYEECVNKLKDIPTKKPKDQWTDDERDMVEILGRTYAPQNPAWQEAYDEKEEARRELSESSKALRKMLLKEEPAVHLKDIGRPKPASEDRYEGFLKNDTGTSMNTQGSTLCEMSPKEYLERCAGMFTDVDGRDTNLTLQVLGLDREAIDDIKDKIKKGVEMYTPWLDERGVNGQEGRHRAAAAYELGIEKIPVVYWTDTKFDENDVETRADEEPDGWITVNGNHIPVDENGDPLGGQLKALGESAEKESTSVSVQEKINHYGETTEKRMDYRRKLFDDFQKKVNDLHETLREKGDTVKGKRHEMWMLDQEIKNMSIVEGVDESNVEEKKKELQSKIAEAYIKASAIEDEDSDEKKQAEKECKNLNQQEVFLENYQFYKDQLENRRERRKAAENDQKAAEAEYQKAYQEISEHSKKYNDEIDEMNKSILEKYPDYDSLKDVDDVSDYLLAKGYFKATKDNDMYTVEGEPRAPGYVNLKGMNTEIAIGVAKTIDKLYSKYPELPSVMATMTCEEKTKNKAIGMYSYGQITLLRGEFEDVSEDDTPDSTGTFYPIIKGTDKNRHQMATIAHEFGHALDDYLGKKYPETTEWVKNAGSTVSTHIIKQAAKNLGISQKELKQRISQYACKNPLETLAEAFSEYIVSEDPRPEAREIGRQIDHYYQYGKTVGEG